jgi:hypothetical protein
MLREAQTPSLILVLFHGNLRLPAILVCNRHHPARIGPSRVRRNEQRCDESLLVKRDEMRCSGPKTRCSSSRPGEFLGREAGQSDAASISQCGAVSHMILCDMVHSLTRRAVTR